MKANQMNEMTEGDEIMTEVEFEPEREVKGEDQGEGKHVEGEGMDDVEAAGTPCLCDNVPIVQTIPVCSVY